MIRPVVPRHPRKRARALCGRMHQVVAAADTLRAVLRARIVLHRGGFPGAQRHYGLVHASASALREEGGPPPAGSMLNAAARVLRMPGLASTCLPSSLALAEVIHRSGIPCHVVIGVGRWDGAFSAHAWVETAGHRIDVTRTPPDLHREIERFALGAA